jgi:hypothetical protein
MKQPRYRLTADGTPVEGYLTGSMTGSIRRVELVFYTPSHVTADALYDTLLSWLRDEGGWKLTLEE